MIKIAMVGAGSVVFAKNLTGDILGLPEFRDAHLVYMDIDGARLEVAAAIGRKVAKAVGASPTIEATVDRRAAVRDADFVINMVQIGGFESTLVDFEIPRKYGLRFTIGDTTGPGGLFRALRTFPLLRDLCRDMAELCPHATLLNYGNPMSMNMQTVFRAGQVRAVGLCHSVQGTFEQLVRYLGEDAGRVSFTCAGINHMAFFLQLESGGQDLYPRLFQAMVDPAVYATNPVRFELMKRLGYFTTESSEHHAEYSGFFIPHGDELRARLRIPLDEYLFRCDAIVDEFATLSERSRTDEPMRVYPSHEYCAEVIRSIVTGAPTVIYGNLVNGSAVANLPRTAIVEAPTLVDRAGCRHVQVGELPPQVLGYVQPHVVQHELFIRAALEQRRDHVYQACMFDPLTAATLTPDEIVSMCDEMIAAHGDRLPPLPARTLVPTSGISFAPVDASALRRSWDRARRDPALEPVRTWLVLGPFISREPGAVTLDMPTAFESAHDPARDAPVDVEATYVDEGPKLAWKRVVADARGYVSLDDSCGAVEWACAYAYAELDAIHSRDSVLTVGSDDGVKIWLNGEVVHVRDVQRAYRQHDDTVHIQLRAGVNRLLLKVDNYLAGWGFGVAVRKPSS